MTKIQLVESGIDRDSFDDKKLPSDCHLVTYIKDGKEQIDVVRAYTMTDIFDVYYDDLKDKGELLKIESGFGTIRPNLFGKIADPDE
tara:strand:+ start:1370 stop:1630 length:261 start_codon:yes stop_codon:yes gene_type:complete